MQREPAHRRRGCCGGCCLVSLFVLLCALVKAADVLLPMLQFPAQCRHPALPVNQSGVKVVVAGFAKSATRTVIHALNDIGLRAYHSEDFCLTPYKDFASNMRAKYEEYRTLDLPGFLTPLLNDPRAAEEFAMSLSRCRVDAIAFDGLEELVVPVLSASPGAKVIVLDWRSFGDYRRSLAFFMPKLVAMASFVFFVYGSSTVVPWGALVKVLDPLVGSPIGKALSDGGPPVCEVSGPLMFFHYHGVNHYNHYPTWRLEDPSLVKLPASEADYLSFFESVRQQVGPGDATSWDPRKNTFEDLCAFVGVDPCPKTGRFPRAINTWIFELSFPLASLSNMVLHLFLYWVNWRLAAGVLATLWRGCSRLVAKAHTL